MVGSDVRIPTKNSPFLGALLVFQGCNQGCNSQNLKIQEHQTSTKLGRNLRLTQFSSLRNLMLFFVIEYLEPNISIEAISISTSWCLVSFFGGSRDNVGTLTVCNGHHMFMPNRENKTWMVVCPTYQQPNTTSSLLNP